MNCPGRLLCFAGVTLANFNLLHHLVKLRLVDHAGTHLATRPGEYGGIHLYHLPGGFFVEVHDDGDLNRITHVVAFDDVARLMPYIDTITLPEW